MNPWESLRLSLRALAANKLRSSLTMLGVIIGVGAVIALLSIGQGAQAAITSQIQGVGSNLVVVLPGAIQRAGVPRAAAGSAPTLTIGDSQALANARVAPSAALVAPYVQRQYQIVYNGENVNTVIFGVTPEYAGVRNMKVAQGRYISNNDVETLARVAVLGKIPAQNLFKGADPIGQVVKIQQVPFRVVGVLVEKGGVNAFGGSQDDVILVPLSTAQIRLIGSRAVTGSSRLVSAINISAVSEEKVDQLVQEITLELRRRHKIQFTGDDFTIITQKDLLGAFSQVTTILTIFLGAIAAISLLVGGIGIMNIMLVSVTERTREIGLRKAIGAKRWDILVQFLIEAVTLSILGGAIGILMGAGISAAVNSTGQITTEVSLESVALAVGFSLAVGLFFGIYPAVRASGLSPIEALRYE